MPNASPAVTGLCIFSLLLPSAAIASNEDETWLDYVPLKHAYKAQMWSRDLKTGKPIAAMTEFSMAPTKANRSETLAGEVIWSAPNQSAKSNDSVEEWAVKTDCKPAQQYVWLNAFRQRGNLKNRFEIRTLRYEFVDLKTKQTHLATADCQSLPDGSLRGQPYALFKLGNEPYKMKVWMVILTRDGKPGKRVYWEHTVEALPEVLNTCWDVDKKQKRPAIKQTEAWWEIFPARGKKQGEWKIGGSDSPPFDSELKPVEPSKVWHGRVNYFGKNVGAGWLGGKLNPQGEEIFRWCMRRTWLD